MRNHLLMLHISIHFAQEKPKHFIMKRFQKATCTEEIAATTRRNKNNRLGASGTNVLNSTNSPRQEDPTSHEDDC